MTHYITISSIPAKSYPILIGVNLHDINVWFPKEKFSQIVIITDHTVKKRYGFQLQNHLRITGYPCLLLSFPSGEKHKNNKNKQALEHAMLQNHCGRDTLILALGGGVVGDLAGFIAATYLRGVPYIQIPTTLLAMVDSSVGGKTGINTDFGKNLIGAIHQPMGVVADITLLKSLSKKQWIDGLIEVIKMFLTHDASGFQFIQTHLPRLLKKDEDLTQNMISRAVAIKSGVVERDEKEKGERSVLNFGHTMGHALEKCSHYTLLHGYAVGYGILIEACISYLQGLLPLAQLQTIQACFAQLGIHGNALQKYEISDLIQATKHDKKNYQGQVHYTLLKEVGSVYITEHRYVHPVSEKLVSDAFKYMIENEV